MPARNLGGLLASSAGGSALPATWHHALPATWRHGRGARRGRLAASILLTLILAGVVAWFIDTRVTQVMLAELVERATDQVELGVASRVTLADFEPPYTPARLDALNAQLDSILDRVRESGSGVIRVNLFARDGTVLYSDLASLRGQVVSPLTDPLLAAALAGSAGAEVVPLTGQADADLGPRYGSAMEAYVPCIVDGRVVGAYELYAESGLLWPIRRTIWPCVGLGFGLLLGGIIALGRGPASSAGRADRNEAVGVPGPPTVIKTGLVQLHPNGDTALVGAAPRSASRAGRAPANPAAECWLSRREMEVLRLLATDRTYREIAGELSLSEETVRSHVKSILHKLGQHDRARAVAAAIQAGVLG